MDSIRSLYLCIILIATIQCSTVLHTEIQSSIKKDSLAFNVWQLFKPGSTIPSLITGCTDVFIPDQFKLNKETLDVHVITDLSINITKISNRCQINKKKIGKCKFREFDVICSDNNYHFKIIINVIFPTTKTVLSFKRSEISEKISEAALLNTSIIYLNDAEIIGNQSVKITGYKLTNHKATFKLSSMNPEEPRTIILIKKLDRETKASYRLILEASDNRGQISQQIINIIIQDENDNLPVFLNNYYSTKINEDVQIGSRIISVSATDSDIGENGEIIYKIEKSSERLPFRINKNTGMLTVKEELDYELRKVYHFIVNAENNVNDNIKASVNITINIINVNDNAPTIHIYNPANKALIHKQQGQYNITRTENTLREGDTLVEIDVTDDDKMNNFPFCSLNDDKYFNLIYDGVLERYRITYRYNTYDREVKSHYTLHLTCNDNDKSGNLSTSIEIRLQLADANDNKPIFIQDIYHAEIPVNCVKGYLVTRIKAIDKDIKNIINYKIDNKYNQTFNVNQFGEITLKEPLREIYYEFKVFAYDVGKLEGSAIIIIKVKGVQSSVSKLYSFKVEENKAKGEIVGNLKEFGYKKWTILDKSLPFRINNDGIIRTSKIFDAENSLPIYKFKVRSIYQNKFVSNNVEIRINDKNEYKPFFIFPIEDSQICYCTLCNVRAIDKDRDASLIYTIVNDSKSIKIDKETGNITCIEELSADIIITVHVSSLQHNIYSTLKISMAPSAKAQLFHSSNRVILMLIILVSLIIVLTISVTGVYINKNKDSNKQNRSYQKGVTTESMIKDSSQGHIIHNPQSEMFNQTLDKFDAVSNQFDTIASLKTNRLNTSINGNHDYSNMTCNTYTDIIPRKVISDNDSGCFHGIEDCSGASSNISSNDPHILKGTSTFAPIPRLTPKVEPHSLGIPSLNTPTLSLQTKQSLSPQKEFILRGGPSHEVIAQSTLLASPQFTSTLGRRSVKFGVDELDEGAREDQSKTRSLGRPQVEYSPGISWDLDAAADYLRDTNNADSCV